MTDIEKRNETIDYLHRLKGELRFYIPGDTSREPYTKALDFAISSITTGLKYDLLYEETTKETNMKYDFIEFKTAFREGNLKVGDKLITTDLCGDAIFEVADIRKKKIFMVRKYVLPDHDKTHDKLMGFLNNEYLMSLPVEISSAIIQRDDNFIFVPREVEVFGKHEFSDPEEKGRQWKIFEKTKGRIRCGGDAYGPGRFWWLCSPIVSNSTNFCIVNTSGAPAGSSAGGSGGVLPCFIINPKALA